MKEIGLQELIEQVRQELLALPKNPDPVFFVDKVELELNVEITREEQGNIKIYVLSLGASASKKQGQVVKITLSSVLSREEIIKEVRKDPEAENVLMIYAKRAFTKSSGTVGDI